MVKNYVVFFVWVFLTAFGFSQEIKVFSTADFDLKGPIKTCLVVTNYGKEKFEFDPEGRLTKLETRYNDRDYSITHYKFDGGVLTEKRLEHYRDGRFDGQTSIAHLFTTDTSTTDRTVIENIYSYEKDFLDQYAYHFDTDGMLRKILRSNDQGLDETTIAYSTYKDETTKTFFLNEVIQKSVRTSEKKTKNGSIQKNVLTKEFLEGKPDKAVEQLFDASGKLLTEAVFVYDTGEKSFVSASKKSFGYDDAGMLQKTLTKTGDDKVTKEYIYQFDGSEANNWVKEIIIPDNAFTTRKITYYESKEKMEKE